MADWGVIFDWDGVVVDSSRQHELSWQRLAEEEGLSLPEGFFRKSFGMKNQFIIPKLLGWCQEPSEIQRLSDRKEALYREIVAETGVEVLSGAYALLDSLDASGVPCGLGTSTPRNNLEAVIDRLHLRDYFAAIVTGEEVTDGKPNPDVFLKVAEKLDLAPERCVVIEDAHAGIQAAKRGGMGVVAVATTHPADTLQEADLVRSGPDHLDLAMLRELVKRGVR